LKRISGELQCFLNTLRAGRVYRPLYRAVSKRVERAWKIGPLGNQALIVTRNRQAAETFESKATMKKRMEITIETERVMLARSRQSQLVWCEGCAAAVAMLTVDEAAALAGESSRSVYRRVEAGELHFAETVEGRLFICSNSLA
jgi:hypothetical protein